jgi:hypothetical protein
MFATPSARPFELASDRPSEGLYGLSIAEAREARDYWRRREAELPWHRRAARAEAREMSMRWRHRLLNARLERWGIGHASLLAPIVVMLHQPRRQQARRVGSLLLKTRFAKRLLLMAGAFTIASVATLALVAVLASQLL